MWHVSNMEMLTVPPSNDAPAFSLPDAELALRWSAAMDPARLRLIVTPGLKDADEAVEVYVCGQQTAAFVLTRRIDGVALTDCLGMATVFATLADALGAVSPGGSVDRRALLDAGPGQCMSGIDPRFVGEHGVRRTRLIRLAGAVRTLWARARNRRISRALQRGTCARSSRPGP